MDARSHTIGVLLILASTAFFAMAGVFTKMINADAWVIAGWRGLIGSALIAVYIFWPRRGRVAPRRLWLDWRGWFLVILSSVASSVYIIALKHTYVANVAVIYATTPFLAAGIAFVILRERVRAMMIATSALSLVGVATTVWSGFGGTRLFGDVMALIMTVLFAFYFVAVKGFKDTPIQWTAVISGFMIFLVSILVADPMSIAGRDLLLCLFFGFTFSIALMLMAEGVRMIPVAETALIGTLDVPFAIGFAWLVIGETPPLLSMIGALIVVAAVALQGVGDYYRARRKQS